MAQSEVTIILPYLNKDNGTDQHDTVEELVKRVYSVSGGVSTWEQVGFEVWDDAVYRDNALRVVTIVDKQHQITALRDIALAAIELLHQRGGIFFQVIGNGNVKVEFLDRDDIAASVR
jgi:hypothetical protein